MTNPAPPPDPAPRRRRRWAALLAASAGGALLVAGLGWSLAAAALAPRPDKKEEPFFGWAMTAAGDWLARHSYDLLFVLRGPGDVPEARIVYLDERSAAKLGQGGGVWDRSIHAQLVRRLTRDGAHAVFFDVVFPDTAPDPASDAELAAAMAEHGRVFIGAPLELDYGANVLQERVVPPTPALRRAAAGWGLIAFRPIDPDYGVRRIYPGLDPTPSATWRAAERLGAALPTDDEGRAEPRWLNYYGPPNAFPNVSYDRALSDDELPPEFFRDQIVFIGGRSTLGTLSLGKDDFRTPFGLLGSQFATGVEIHLTALLNLLRGDWLRRMDPRHELTLVLLCGIAAGGGLPWLRPNAAALVAALFAAAVLAIALGLHTRAHLWWAWLIPGTVQPALALGWAVGARYFLEERRRRRLIDAFSRYLSPHMAKRIADAEFDLTPGGKVLRATVMFTDLEGYSRLCERLEDPQRIARVLNTYYTRTIGHILDNDGTVIKYMGDSIQAVWGAPLPDADQLRKAVRAAWKLHAASLEECEGFSLRTRIGLNCDLVLAGNLGSDERFDFAVIGTPVNLASRFEGLNKYLGTDILLSESIRAGVGAEFDTRPLGQFRVAGNQKPQTLHELLGPAGTAGPRPWLEPFARALAAFQRGDLVSAEAGMSEADALHPGGDGPARFFLSCIGDLRQEILPTEWDGVVNITTK
jgi:class 3 adenylate cyclase/CHASE2 domain-containing sensor protein